LVAQYAPRALFHHPGQDGLDQRNHREHVGLELQPQLVRRQFGQRPHRAVAGVVDQHPHRDSVLLEA
jgi:hypothetical protein